MNRRLSEMSAWLKFASLNALVGLAAGVIVSLAVVGSGYYFFAAAAPMACFACGAVFWKLLASRGLTKARAVWTGVLTGSVSHYLTFVLLSVQLNICYGLSGQCTDSLGSPPASVGAMIIGAPALSLFSLILAGWLTVPIAIAIALFVRRTTQRTHSDS